MPAEKKITVTNFCWRSKKIVTGQSQIMKKSCFKISGANGVFDIFVDIFKSSRICYFLGGSVVFNVF